MMGRILFRSTVLLLSGMWLAGCIPYTSQRDDPRFAGYHRADPSQGVTAAITDREALIPTAAPDQQPPPGQLEAEKAPADRDYTYQDWYRNRYRNNDAFQLNLSYHLYGPYYYRDLRSRYWFNYQRRWNNLPWYAGRSWYNDPRWDYPYWHDSYYDPWYGYYDPWYSYYDPWYSGRSYGYYGSYYGWQPWYGYGTTTTGSVQTVATERRSRGRRDLPTGLAPGSDSGMPAISVRTADPLAGLGPESGISTTKTAASQSGRSKSSRWGRRQDSGSSGSSGKQARSSSRQGSYTSSSGSSSSSSSGSSATKSSSSSSQGSSSTKSARPRSRKP